MNNIFLCGFAGCGKTTVGKELARLAGMEYVDMDVFIEERQGKKVTEIFAERGEVYFRGLEAEAACELAARSGLVVATGGGAVKNSENIAAFKSGGLVVLIDIPLDVIVKRLEGDSTRPLFNGPDKIETMRRLYDERMPLYRAAADITAENPDNRPALYVAEQIIKKIKASADKR